MNRRLLMLYAVMATTVSAQLGSGPWRTDSSKHSIDLKELKSGGPGKDGIPALRQPRFVTVEAARPWLEAKEPIIVFEHVGEVRAYPLQILMWHELVNDKIGDTPVLISYCPLCNSTVVFDRRIDGRIHEFGVSGMLRDSDMVMFDRETETLWQQITGEAIVGSLTGKQLEILPSQTISFELLAHQFPDALVLSRETGYSRQYGSNPYVGYESANRVMFPVRTLSNMRIRLMEQVVAISEGGKTRAYPFSLLRQNPVVADQTGSEHYVVFFEDDVRSALDAERISQSRKVGAVGVFSPELAGRTLSFSHQKGIIRDAETGSSWNLLGVATAGPLAGARLNPVRHHVAFAFAWLVFRPETELVTSLLQPGK